jgi:outer membrane protein OmpA-like peptidoglycan-associated protein
VKRLILSSTLCSLLILAGCSGPREYYGMTGDKGSMTVTSRDVAKPGTATLDAKTPVVMQDGDKVRTGDISADQLRSKFAKALEAQPLAPKRFTLYFVEGGDTLTAESQAAVNAIFEEIKQRPAPDLIVVGHTDRVGSVAANDQLAAKRANSMRDQLIKRGVDAENIQASGRGEREPLVPTADEVAEPRNRRVEILVR